MNQEILKQLSDLTASRDRVEFSLGDTYDIKASIVLVIATFLATLSGSILSVQGLAIPIRWLQLLAVIALVISAFYCFRVLWPRHYRLEGNPKKIRDWLELQIKEGGLDAASALQSQMIATENRIAVNRAFNMEKSAMVIKSFYWVFAAFGCQILSLLCLLPSL